MPKKNQTDPFKLAREVAEAAIGGPLFKPKKITPKKPRNKKRTEKRTQR